MNDANPKARKRNNRKKKGGGAKINYINMHGGRTREKWLEVHSQLEKEQTEVYAFTETFLRDLEEPPVIQEYIWQGCNRTVGTRKGEGSACLLNREPIGTE